MAAGYAPEELDFASAQKQIEIYASARLLAADNFAVQRPEWVLKHERKLFLDPGVKEVRSHIVDTISEVCCNYSIDAIHFDDYFYPSGFGEVNADPETASDGIQSAQSAGEFSRTAQGLNDWRRSNTDALVQAVHQGTSAHNALARTSVQFGISPAAIWNSRADDPRGSHTPENSGSSYHDLYCDTYKWIKNEWLDYVVPQIYSAFGDDGAPYATLARWWNGVAEGTRVQVYVGQAIYRVGTGTLEWTNPRRFQTRSGSTKRWILCAE